MAYSDGLLDERIYALWDRLAAYDATQAEEALRFLQESLCHLLDADNADWIGIVRLDHATDNDPVAGWRPRVVRLLHPNEAFERNVREQTRNVEQGKVNIAALRMMAAAGRFRAARLCDLVEPEWFGSPFYACYYRDCGHGDALYVAAPINADAESCFGLFRAVGRPSFTEDERDLAAQAMRGLKWFQRRLLLSHGLLITETPLTETEREIIHDLLGGLSEKDIAARISRSRHTVHEHIRNIYRKFGVGNRAALLALWLGRAP